MKKMYTMHWWKEFKYFIIWVAYLFNFLRVSKTKNKTMYWYSVYFCTATSTNKLHEICLNWLALYVNLILVMMILSMRDECTRSYTAATSHFCCSKKGLLKQHNPVPCYMMILRLSRITTSVILIILTIKHIYIYIKYRLTYMYSLWYIKC